ncbi:hypothetical protein [Singulisphaera sp. PoT]|uniref:hypothetical protein n=1 Tax=Singulisphaera sp. PoT TaxID=3411797 RepID=UPI003BF4F598
MRQIPRPRRHPAEKPDEVCLGGHPDAQEPKSFEDSEDRLSDALGRLDTALEAGAIATWSWDIPNDRVIASHDRRGLGLLGMRERVSLVGGILTVESSKGKGTFVRTVIPLHGRVRRIDPNAEP